MIFLGISFSMLWNKSFHGQRNINILKFNTFISFKKVLPKIMNSFFSVLFSNVCIFS